MLLIVWNCWQLQSTMGLPFIFMILSFQYFLGRDLHAVWKTKGLADLTGATFWGFQLDKNHYVLQDE